MPPSGCLHAHGVCKALHSAISAAARGLLNETQKLQLPARAAEAHGQVLHCYFVHLQEMNLASDQCHGCIHTDLPVLPEA